MLIRLIPPSPHPTVLYALTFPSVLPLHDISPTATIPAAWSSQLQIITSMLQIEPPSSIHMLDRAVGLVARVCEVSMNVPQKEFVVKFVDGRATNLPMSSDCVRMLLGVVLDVKGCSEPESQRSSVEGGASHESTAGTTDDLQSSSRPIKSFKNGKHKRQRSLLFSLISSLVPKSLSSSSPPPASAPPLTPLPPLPVAGRVTFPAPPKTSFDSAEPNPDLLRRRARATLVDVWRRHVISALTPQHLPAAGYLEWTLIAMASKVRAEMESIEIDLSHGFGGDGMRTSGSKHRRAQSESRNALYFGDCSGDCRSERWHWRSPSPLSDILNAEDTDRVVYPRREQADEWGVRHAHSGSDEVDVFAVEYTGHNDSLLGEHFAVGDDWDDNERLTFELSRLRHYNSSGKHLHPGDFNFQSGNDGGGRLGDVAFDLSKCPLIPSDVNDEEPDDNQTSFRTSEDGEDLSLASPTRDPALHASKSLEEPGVSRVGSFHPCSRNASAQFSNPPFTHPSPPPSPSSRPPSAHDLRYGDTRADELLASGFEYLERVCAALEVVRSRAREEGWRHVRATNGCMDAEAERALEIKAKRRAWSSGIKIPAPYPTSRSASKVWDGTFSIFRSPVKPPGLTSPLTRIPQLSGPIVPIGLSLGIPMRSSPLSRCAWSADDRQSHSLNKYGSLSLARNMEMMEGKRSSRVSFANSGTDLFPVCEDENENLFEPVQDNVVGFPQTLPFSVPSGEPEGNITEGLMENEDDPFYFSPSRPRTRTMSMYAVPPISPAPDPPTSRPSTPPPSYQVATVTNDEGKLDASALLLQPLSSLSVSSSSRLPLTSNHSFIPRPRAISLPTFKSYSSANKSCCTPLNHNEERFEDLSQAYASPPPEGPLVISATRAPCEEYPRYAHIHSPIPSSKKSHEAILRRTGREVVFEQVGSEFTVGIEVALGRAEEGRVVW